MFWYAHRPCGPLTCVLCSLVVYNVCLLIHVWTLCTNLVCGFALLMCLLQKKTQRTVKSLPYIHTHNSRWCLHATITLNPLLCPLVMFSCKLKCLSTAFAFCWSPAFVMDSILLAMGQLSAAEKAQLMLALTGGSAVAEAIESRLPQYLWLFIWSCVCLNFCWPMFWLCHTGEGRCGKCVGSTVIFCFVCFILWIVFKIELYNTKCAKWLPGKQWEQQRQRKLF